MQSCYPPQIKPLLHIVALLGVGLAACSPAGDGPSTAASAAAVPTRSVMDQMVGDITTSTNTLWGIDNPQTDAEWQVFADAANKTIAAFEQIRSGGAGPNDKQWATDPKWQLFVDQEVTAANAIRTAVGTRDLAAVQSAGEALYNLCEACHLEFNQGVKNAR